MKSLLLATIITCIVTVSGVAQGTKKNDALEQTIRKLEQQEDDAVLRGDVAALEKIWAEDFTVNNPQNQISRGRKEVLDRIRAGLLKYSSFTREIEEVKLYGDTVVVMGLEVVTPVGSNPKAGQAVRRRFTNIWMKRNGQWLLSVRHANVICQE